MSDNNQPEPLSDIEIALIDSIKTIIEMLAAKQIAKPEEFAPMFEHQRDQVVAKHQPAGAAVFELLRAYCLDPKRKQFRGLATSPPEGSA